MKSSLCAALFLALATPLVAQNAIDQHIEAIGGAAALAGIQSMERNGKARVITPSGTFGGSIKEVYDLEGDRGFTLLSTGVFYVESGWTGDAGWRNHSLEGFSEMDAGALGLAKMSSSPSIIASVVRQYGMAAIQPLAPCTYQDEECDVVRFVGSPVEILVSRESHLILAIVIPDVMTYHYSDYEDVGGFRLPGKSVVQIPGRQLTIEYEYKKTSFDGKLKDKMFKSPR